MQRAGLLVSEDSKPVANDSEQSCMIPAKKERQTVGPSEARQGRDRLGNPGWFIEDVLNPGEYIQVELN